MICQSICTHPNIYFRSFHHSSWIQSRCGLPMANKIGITELTLFRSMRRTKHHNLAQLAKASKGPSCECYLAKHTTSRRYSRIVVLRVCGFLSVLLTIGPNLSYGVFRTYDSDLFFPCSIPKELQEVSSNKESLEAPLRYPRSESRPPKWS